MESATTRSKPRRKIIYAGIVLRRRWCLRYWLILPVLYLIGLILCARPLSRLFFPLPPPGSVYHSHQIFHNLRLHILTDDSPAIQLSSLWMYKKLKIEKPCKITYEETRMEMSVNNGYLIVEANGGLNQQRSSICNAVAVAGFLNATLVIPRLEYHNVWMDRSHFDDIYDEQHFINTLAGFVRVTRELPTELMEQYDHEISNVPIVQVPAWSPISYYLEEVFPILRNQGLVRIAPFANRLSMYIPPDIQYLRCLTNYKALKFAPPISALAKNLIKRMIEKSPKSDGKYVSVHLRFEEDMVAFSCCIYDGGKKEQFEMDFVREKGWKGKFRRRGTVINPGLNRISGKCPLTPVEVGMMLRGMGFDNNTLIYLASGKLYQEERQLSPLLEMFPLLYTKESLASPQELAYFKGYSSRLAALDYAVCLQNWDGRRFFEEPIMLIAFVLLGRNLEQRAKIKATSDLTSLLSILPSKARLLVNNAEDTVSTVEIPCSSLSVGDKIVVLPGDRVPADGIVRAGRSTVDESSFSGEPLPVTKLPGTEVSAGSINLNGTLTIEVQRPGGETTMGDIVRLVEEAQSREAPVQRLADKVAGRFTYGVMALSAATFMFWTLFGSRILPSVISGGSSVSVALQLSCSVLVVACPCALGLATPTAVLVGTSLGAKRGLLLRGGDILEKFSLANVVVFDKTGTLTIGKPVVMQVITHENESLSNSLSDNNSVHLSKAEVLKLAASVESNTIHPVGKAIVEAARSIGCQTFKAADGTFTEEPGSGAVATIENRRVAVGTLEWLQRHGVDNNPFEGLEDQNNSQSVVYVGVDGNLAGLIYIEDQIREDARNVVQSLFNQGIDVYMLSGDKRQTAEHVAAIVGIPKDRVFSGVKPDQKKKFISQLQNDNKIVAMVGDGINDAAALASSHVGVAMGGGVGAASEVSSIVLMGNKLSQVLDALELSKLTMKTIKQNLWWAFGYNIVGLPIAAGMLLPVTGVMLTPSIAGALMGLSSIGVMTNSLLLRLRFSSKQINGSEFSSTIKDQSALEVLVDQKEKLETPFSDSRLKNAS